MFIVVHIAFAVAVLNDAQNRHADGRPTAFVGPFIWMGATLLGIFGLLALALASVGLYGVIAYSVSRRTHEIGIRMALGAHATEVMKLVVRQGMALAVIGVVFGLLLAVAMSRVLATMLYGISAIDLVAFSLASILLLAVAFLANYLPARRAAHVDPMEALRYE